MKTYIVAAIALAGVIARGFSQAPANPPAPPMAYFGDGSVRIISSSHQDTGWVDTPAYCRRFRIDHVLLPAIEMMRKNPKYVFSMENTQHLMELLEAHPELRDELIQRVKEGRLEFGACFNEPYESWFSGEELARETYFGRRWVLKNLPGCDVHTYFNPDPPGRSLQMQQILAKAGIPYMFISRFREGLWRWESPDGSGVLAYSPGAYWSQLPYLNGDPHQCVLSIRKKLNAEASYYKERSIPPSYGFVNTTDFRVPTNFDSLIEDWNAQTVKEAGCKVPLMTYSSMSGFFESVDKPTAKFDTLMGERPDVWVYITGPTHEELASAKREAARLLPAAEIFTTITGLLDGGFSNWPTQDFNRAWLNEIYIDHGIGGKNGQITDEVFFSAIRNARDTGRALLDKALGAIAARVKTNPARGLPITVFNDLSWSRSDVIEMDLPAGVTGPPGVVDADGHEIPSQVTLADSPDEINVAAATMGSRATADSVFSPDYGAEKAIDGRWNVCNPNPETGSSSKWNSGNHAGPHWLAIDFGQARTIHKIVIRHEGVIGASGMETIDNTADFQIQSADTAAGPWSDLVAPVTNNVDSLTVHSFAPKTCRFLRLYITKGAQVDSYARIYEVQAFQKAPPIPKLVFVARDVPSLGYKTFYMVKAPAAKTPPGTSDGCENNYYRVVLAPGGIKSIYDKQQGRELLRTDKFLGGEVFTMLSVANDPGVRAQGTDAGPFASVALPVMDSSFDRMADHKPEWKLIESGPVRSIYQLQQPLADTTVRERLVMWNSLKRIDCDVDLQDFNGRLWREFRMALPLAIDKPKIAYEVPMGVVEIGKDEIPMSGGNIPGVTNYTQPSSEIRPRNVQDFVDASDAVGGVTMSLSVSAFDWIDPTTSTPAGAVLQPILLASRMSCNGSGNWYPQAGDHHFRFAITSHNSDWHNGWRDGIAANHPLHPVIGARQRDDAQLPEAKSFFNISGSNAMISTIKKCEDDNSVIVRLVEMEGRDSTVSISSFLPVLGTNHTNIIEQNGKPISSNGRDIHLSVGHYSIETLKMDIPVH